MDILSRNYLTQAEYIFTPDPDHIYENLSPSFSVNLYSYACNDLWRYCAYNYNKDGLDPDFDKVIRIALSEYLEKEFSEKDALRVEEIKFNEIKRQKEQIKENKPVYEWVKSIKSKIRKDK